MKNKIYIYNKTGNQYRVLGDAKFKHPETREWVKCIIYQSVDTGETYVRETGEFMERFTEQIKSF
ncbi:MAG: hypothetical protein J6I84_03040 [Bacilli bacterium]|nr:hypothetical protein [Bacilli bacterium]